jgi:hypothetical protein
VQHSRSSLVTWWLVLMSSVGTLTCASNPCRQTKLSPTTAHARGGTCTNPQGGLTEPKCNVAVVWRLPGYPHLNAWVDSDCPSTGPLHVTIRIHDSELASEDVPVELKVGERPRFETPSFPRPSSGTLVELSISGKCTNGERLWTTTSCPMP